MKLYIEQIPAAVRPILAGAHTIWPRPEAVTLQERTIEHCCTAVPGNRPIGIGQGYSTIAWIPEESGSWALPLRHERITSWQTPIEKAAWQLRQVCGVLPVRPISLWDCEYGCAPFVLKTADIPADKLMRLRSNLCLWTAPPAYGGQGRPRKHGQKFKLNDSSTWGEADEHLEVDDSKLGLLRIHLWSNLHFRGAASHPMHKPIDKLTPGRVAQAFAGVLAAIDTPAQAPKPRGNSPGWPQGQSRQPRTRYPLVKKGSNRVKKHRNKSS